jgi:hypothetical protein
MLYTHLISRAGTIERIVADVPSGLSHPTRTKLKKKSTSATMRGAVYGVAINSYKILLGKSSTNFSIYYTVKWILLLTTPPGRYIGRVELHPLLTSTLN